jgi:chemotaxis protein MotB
MVNPTQPIIIKKIKKVSGGGHHGGAWKVAYADFVTAMMAFFLLMWLLNATSEEQKKGISNYFGPVGMSTAASGSGGVLGGKSIATEGSFEDSKASPAVTMLTPQTNAGEAKSEGNEAKQKAAPAKDAKETVENKGEAAAQDKKNFAEAEVKIRQAIQKSPELAQFADNLIIDMTPEGMRIQIVDQDKKSMFPSGEKKMYDHTVKLLQAITSAIKPLPNAISITGHTDNKSYGKASDYTNWELSADRANASRQVMVSAGLNESRVSHVTGKAATEPLAANDPSSSQNRRISIILLNTE